MRNMKKLKKAQALLLAFALIFGIFAVPGSTYTVEAAAKVTVKKVTAVDSLTGSKTINLAKGRSIQ